MSEPRRPRLLVVDDEPYLRDAIARDFGRRGYQVTCAASGGEALQLLQRSPCDVVLTDVRMPGGDGIELLHLIKRDIDPSLPVVFITGFSEMSAEEAFSWGAEAVFAKPFDRRALFLAVAETLKAAEQRWQLTEEWRSSGLQLDLRLAAGGAKLEVDHLTLQPEGLRCTIARAPAGLMIERQVEVSIFVGGDVGIDFSGTMVVRELQPAGLGAGASCAMELVERHLDPARLLVRLVNILRTTRPG